MKTKILPAVYLLIISSNAYAYLDPGTGSIIIQGLIAAFLSVALVVKTYWFKVLGFIKKIKTYWFKVLGFIKK